MTQRIHRRHIDDTITVLPVTLMQLNSSGTPTATDLTGKTVKFKMYNMADNVVAVAETTTGVTVVTAASGTVNYDFSAAGVATAGKYYGFFVVYDSTETDHFPVSKDGLIILIDSDDETAEEAYQRQLNAETYDPYTVTSFPSVLVIGDSYLDTAGREIHVPIVDEDGAAMSSTGSRNFSDATITFTISRIGETAAARVITGTATWVDPVGTGGANDPYVSIELPASETAKGLQRYKYIGVLTFTWAGPGTDVMSFRTEEINFTV